MSAEILVGDCLAVLGEIDAGSVQCCVTSPPYFGLRDYGHEGQIGLEATPDEAMVVRPTAKREAWQAEDDYARTQVGGTMLSPPLSKTTGFAATCDHDDGTGAALVLDPFAGSGTTTLQVAVAHGRRAIGIDLNPEYAELARRRLTGVTPSMFDAVVV